MGSWSLRTLQRQPFHRAKRKLHPALTAICGRLSSKCSQIMLTCWPSLEKNMVNRLLCLRNHALNTAISKHSYARKCVHGARDSGSQTSASLSTPSSRYERTTSRWGREKWRLPPFSNATLHGHHGHPAADTTQHSLPTGDISCRYLNNSRLFRHLVNHNGQ